MKQLYMPIPAIVLTLLAILANYHSAVAEMPPSSFSLLMSLLFILGWIFMVIFSIKYYYTVVLFFFSIFWFACFIFCTIPAFIVAFDTIPFDFMQITNAIFVSPLYGIRDFLSALWTYIASAGFSVLMAMICFLCSRRKGDSLPKEKRKRKKRTPKTPSLQ